MRPPKVQYHSSPLKRLDSILAKGVQLPRYNQDVTTFQHSIIPTVSTADEFKYAEAYNPSGVVFELLVDPSSKWARRTIRNMRKGENLVDAVNRWVQEVFEKGYDAIYVEGMQSTVGNQILNPSILTVTDHSVLSRTASTIKYKGHLYREALTPEQKGQKDYSALPVQGGGRARSSDYEDVGFGEAGFWGNAGSGLLFTTGEKILLLERSAYVEEPHDWAIPGGAVPQEEDGSFMDALDSAEMETEEELGIVPSYAVIDKYVFQSGSFHYTTFICKVSPDAEALDFDLNWENDSWGWFTPEELSEVPLHFGVADVLKTKKRNLFQ